jgi:pimeloyl-ACP methyl ester carboxylesterase
MRTELPELSADARRARIQRRVSLVFLILLVVLAGYFGYVGYEGSRRLTAEGTTASDCRTPAVLGWDYEAINYDISADEATGQGACRARAGTAGDEVVAADGTRIAGWWIPSASGIGPGGPTVVLAHAEGGSKSAMLQHAGLLRSEYNVVAFDFRQHGQSGGEMTTQGVLEQQDLAAMLDWLEATKAPTRIAVLGVRMGGATAAGVARGDARVEALILDSTHPTLVGAVEAGLSAGGYPLALPAAWAILFGGLIRTGIDLSVGDPLHAVDDLDDRPLLVLHRSADTTLPSSSPHELYAAARRGRVDAELHVCDGATPDLASACRGQYAAWVLGFLARTFGTS